MRVLITGAAGRLGRAIAAALRPEHQLRLADTGSLASNTGVECIQADLLEPEAVWAAVRNVDAVIHTGDPPADLPADELARDQSLLDWATRGTHVLFQAAIDAGVKRLVYASTLEAFRAYPDDVYISELWRPLPAPDMPVMSRYLGELACREFARDHMATITALRLGQLVIEEEVEDQTPDLMWLDVRDAAQAFRCAIRRDDSTAVWWTRRWGLYHVCAEPPHPKYLIDQAKALGFKPEHNFQRHWAPAQT
jgi:nucleoside-diphosphate-sugar epimerase